MTLGSIDVNQLLDADGEPLADRSQRHAAREARDVAGLLCTDGVREVGLRIARFFGDESADFADQIAPTALLAAG